MIHVQENINIVFLVKMEKNLESVSSPLKLVLFNRNILLILMQLKLTNMCSVRVG